MFYHLTFLELRLSYSRLVSFSNLGANIINSFFLQRNIRIFFIISFHFSSKCLKSVLINRNKDKASSYLECKKYF